jgi:hypothetical protein
MARTVHGDDAKEVVEGGGAPWAVSEGVEKVVREVMAAIWVGRRDVPV